MCGLGRGDARPTRRSTGRRSPPTTTAIRDRIAAIVPGFDRLQRAGPRAAAASCCRTRRATAATSPTATGQGPPHRQRASSRSTSRPATCSCRRSASTTSSTRRSTASTTATAASTAGAGSCSCTPTTSPRSGFADGDVVDIVSEWTDGVERRAAGFRVVAYPTRPGSCAAYFPETNVLVPLDSIAEGSRRRRRSRSSSASSRRQQARLCKRVSPRRACTLAAERDRAAVPLALVRRHLGCLDRRPDHLARTDAEVDDRGGDLGDERDIAMSRTLTRSCWTSMSRTTTARRCGRCPRGGADGGPRLAGGRRRRRARRRSRSRSPRHHPFRRERVSRSTPATRLSPTSSATYCDRGCAVTSASDPLLRDLPRPRGPRHGRPGPRRRLGRG